MSFEAFRSVVEIFSNKARRASMKITEILRFLVFPERITSLGASDIDPLRSWATIPAPVSVRRRPLVLRAERESSRRVMSPWQNGFIGLLQKGESLLPIIGRQQKSEMKSCIQLWLHGKKRKEPIMILAQLPGNGTGNYETRVRRKIQITPLQGRLPPSSLRFEVICWWTKL